MSHECHPPALLRFGIFEVDLRSGELRKQGVRIKLQEQPFLVLKILLGRPGEIVSREELQSQIWSADTFVDFDNSLNTSINKLREALGDSADSPRFIETVPRRGYRFIAPVSSDGEKELATGEARRGLWKTVVPLSLLLIAGLLLAGLIWRWRHAAHLTAKDTVVLGDFANSTGEGVFDGALRQGLSVQLEQSPFIKLVSEEQIHQTERMMGQKASAQLTPEVAREICQRTNSAAALNGSIALIGTRYDLILRAVNCASGDLLVSTEAQANDKSSVLDALGKIALEMREKLGESLGTVQKYNVPLVQATTPSLEALHFYSMGVQIETQTGDFAASLPFFQEAVERDPNFAMAYWAIGDAYSNMGEGTASAEYERKAFGLRAGVSELEKLVIEGDYYYLATGDLMNARRSFELISKSYPRSGYAYDMLAFISNAFGQYDAALNQCRESIHLASYNSRAHRHIVLTYLLLNRVEDALAAAQEAHARGLDSRLAPVVYVIGFYKGDTAEMTRQIAVAVGKPGEEDMLWALEADTEAFFGHLQKARELSRRAVESAERSGEKETAGVYSAVSALREALVGNVKQARQQAGIAQHYSNGRDLDYGIALALAYAGDANGTQKLVDEFATKFHEDTVVQINYLPTLRAKLALRHFNSQQALDLLETAVPYELGLPAYSDYNWPNLYPVYVRGEAYLAAHQGREAASEFQKILDHRNIVLNELIGALAHLEIGRAYATEGDSNKAKAAYEDFLTLWKDADPDIPILKEAKAEYAKLQ
jgi:DNA-binding winged helix-turn-helix (wHTH) protein/tetratricopeptide (TPR) repeat protein